MSAFDPLTTTVIHDLLVSVAEEMGEALVRSAHSPNIKERRDCSCALFDGEGRLVAQASHIPVHLGSLASAVEEARNLPLLPGDMVLLNDPYRGGAHLPDITLVAPFFEGGAEAVAVAGGGPHLAIAGTAREAPSWYVASRAHHADVGGPAPGSLAVAREIFQEGLIIPPVRLVREGQVDLDILAMVLANTRTPWERRADLEAQIGAGRVGLVRLGELVRREGAASLAERARQLFKYSEARIRAVIAAIPEGEWRAEDALDDDGLGSDPLPLRVRLCREGADLVVDFAGTAPAAAGNVNAVRAVTRAAVLYVLCALAGEELPVNAGCLAPIRLTLPEGSLVNAVRPAAVAAGNVETSQRIVDVLLRALAPALPDRVPAASQGTMNNLTLGGVHPGDGRAFSYYETIAGGMGASPRGPGLSAVQTHMTNTRNTPIEVLEQTLPLRVTRYAVRRGSGGEGRHRGGDGVVREFEFLAPVTVSLHTERRRLAPWGLAGGGAGAPGRNVRTLPDGRRVELPGKVTYNAAPLERLTVETPGGGGFGPPSRDPADPGPPRE